MAEITARQNGKVAARCPENALAATELVLRSMNATTGADFAITLKVEGHPLLVNLREKAQSPAGDGELFQITRLNSSVRGLVARLPFSSLHPVNGKHV